MEDKEDLDDVQLDVALITDNTDVWAIPSKLAYTWRENPSWSAEQAVLTWWSDLHEADNRIHEEFGPERRAILKDLLIEFDAFWADYRNTALDQQALRRIIVKMIRNGLTTAQVGDLIGSTRAQVVRTILPNVPMDDCAVAARMRAEDMLRTGRPYPQIADSTGLAKHQITKWAKTLQIAAPEPGLGKAPKQKAYELYDAGFKVRDIVDQLNKHFPDKEFKPMTVYQWINRRKKAQ